MQTNKTNCMSDEAFADLKSVMEGSLDFERGERRDLKVTKPGLIEPFRRPEELLFTRPILTFKQ